VLLILIIWSAAAARVKLNVTHGFGLDRMTPEKRNLFAGLALR
jgi:hypothetical protein